MAETLARFPLGGEVTVDIRPCDREEDMLVEDIMQRGCGCNKWSGECCSKQFTEAYVKETRLGFRELSTKELDLIVMGQLIASTNTSAEVVTTSRHTPLERKKKLHQPFPPRQGDLPKDVPLHPQHRQEEDEEHQALSSL